MTSIETQMIVLGMVYISEIKAGDDENLASSGSELSATVTQQTVTGNYGNLTINRDGTYTYTAFTDPGLAAGEEVEGSFHLYT